MGQGSGFRGKRCFLTGAASGIGRATALKLAAEGAELYLTDRDAEGLETTVADARALGGPGAPSTGHWTSPTTTRSAAFAADIHARHPAMDVVMNIAGVSAWGTVEQLTHQHWKSMIDINLMGPIHVIETFVPPMVAAGRGGHLVNVSSAAGLVALPWHAAYSASKYGLRGLSRGAAVRPGPAPHRRVGGGAGRGEDPSGADGSDRGRGPRRPAGASVDGPVRRARGVAGEWPPTRSCAACARNRFLIYTSPDIRALYLFKRTMWWPYSVAMRRVNVLFTRALRPTSASASDAQRLPQSHGGVVEQALAGHLRSRRSP